MSRALLAFRPLARGDLRLLADWLGRPHVEGWWREASDLAAVEFAYGPLVDGSDPTEAFIALRDGTPFGFIQRYLLDDDPPWREAVAVALGELVGAGIDYLIGDETLVGKGLGRQMIAAFVGETWTRYPAVALIVVAVQQDNAASWRALEGAGFRRVWEGMLDSDDPSDQGPSYVYTKPRPEARSLR